MFYKKLLLLWKDADGILVNTVEELDKIGLMYFKRKFGRPVWSIGPVLLSAESRGNEDLSAKIELAMNETEKGVDIRNKANDVKVIIKNAVRNEEKF